MINRQEVAKLFRKAGVNTSVWCDSTDTAFDKVDTIIGTYDSRKYSDFFNRLADLIDPICKNKQVEVNKMAPIEFRADNLIFSNCGETFCADKEGVNAPIDWSYCPNCGARVVQE